MSAVLLGLFNTIGKGLGASAFLGIGSAGRLAALLVLTLSFNFALPSPEKMARGDPLPPLPTHQPSTGHRRGWGARE